MFKTLVLCLSLLCFPTWGCAGEAQPASQDPVLEARMLRIASELRCLVCQNQTIADSHAALAVDLRQQVREQLQAGKTEGEIYGYMTARYGDFVLYRPPWKASTYLLWVSPAVLAVLGLFVLVGLLRRRARMPEELFEEEPAEPSKT